MEIETYWMAYWRLWRPRWPNSQTRLRTPISALPSWVARLELSPQPSDQLRIRGFGLGLSPCSASDAARVGRSNPPMERNFDCPQAGGRLRANRLLRQRGHLLYVGRAAR